MTVLFWINPSVWLLKREIRHNLEFLADNSVLKSGIDSKNYQYHLLQLSYQIPENQLINKFNISPLKKRITMMNQQKSKKAGILKYSLIVPLALALMLSSNAETLVSAATKIATSGGKNNSEKTFQQVSQKQTKSTVKFTAPVIKRDESGEEKIYEKIDNMPQFPGGESELLKYIGQNLKYPIAAQENGIQGKVIIRFVVSSTGKVVNAMVVKSIMKKVKVIDEVVAVGYGVKKATDEKGIVQRQIQSGTDMELLEKEAIRLANSIPDFTPGEIKGKKVAVYYTLPLTFKLE